MFNSYPDQPWHEIVPHLWMGGHDYGDLYDPTPAIVGTEFDLVVSLYRRDGHGPAAGVEHLYLFLYDAALDGEDVPLLHGLADRAADAVRAGRKVLVRCQAGLNRSGLVTALTLIRLGRTPEDAIKLIRAKRSRHALFNLDFVDYLTSGVTSRD